MTINSEDYTAVLSGILAAADKDNASAFATISENIAAKKALLAVQNGNPEDFWFLLAYPMQNLLDGAVASVTKNQYAAFLFKHYDFVESHLSKLFETKEGSPCSADKSRAVICGLAQHFLSGKEIEFNYSGEYTYHLPKLILTTHAEIIAFFEALVSLHHGNPKKYLTQIQLILEAK